MARKPPARKRRQPNRSATRRPGSPRQAARHDPAAEDVLLASLRQALRDPDPIAFWGAATSIVVLVDEPPSELAEALPQGVDLLQMFIDVDVAETTALLHMVGALATDELTRARARRAVRERRQPVPPEISGLADLAVTGTRIFGDLAGDNHMLELTLPGEVRVTLVVYVARKPRPWVKDAFFVPDRLTEVERRFATLLTSDGVSPEGAIRTLDPAQARAALEDALAGAEVVPPKDPEEDDQWPMSRPLVEFVLSRLPQGGPGYDVHGYVVGQDRGDLLVPPGPGDVHDDWLDEGWLGEDDWSEEDDLVDDLDDEVVELVADFLTSPQGRTLPEDDVDALLATLLMSVASTAEDDPLHWCESVVTWAVEEALPRSPLMSHPDVVERAVQLLPLFIDWAHRASGEDAETIEEVAAVLPELLAALPGRWASRPMEVARLDARTEVALMTGDPDLFTPALLVQRVGGVEELRALDTVPLPAEPLVLHEVPEDLHATLAKIDAALDAGVANLAPELATAGDRLDEEFLTACRRLLVQTAQMDPDVLRGRAGAAGTAAAVAWLVGKGNDLVGSGAPVRVKQLTDAFGVSTTPSARAQRLAAAAALPQAPEGELLALGSPRLLVSTARRAIINLAQVVGSR